MKRKTIPPLKTDREAEEFVANESLEHFDLSGFKPVRFEYESKSAKINMRLPESLLLAVKERAAALGMPYQRFIRDVLERAVTPGAPTR